MPFRVLLALALTATFALVGAGFVVFGGDDEPAASAGLRGRSGRPASRPATSASSTRRASTATLADVRGEVAIVTFLYTTCEDTCPLAAQQIRGALDDLGHDVPVIAIAVDPPRDTPERAQEFLAEQTRLAGRMRFLTGPRAELAEQWRAYGIRPQGEGFEHTAHVVLLDRRGVQRIGFPVDKLTPEALAHDVALLEREPAGRAAT